MTGTPPDLSAPDEGRLAAPDTAETIFSIERKWWVLLAVGAGTFMSALDSSVVNTILPVVRSSFGSDIAAVEWVVVIYLLMVSGLLPSFGRLGDLRGHKLVYLTGFFIFIGSSLLCAVARSVNALIAARGLQAIGAAMLAANSPAILTKSFPGSQRGQALGLQATMTYLGLTAGPTLGGWLAANYGWRSVFFINLPTGLAALLISALVIRRDAPSEKRERFDLLGALAFMAGLIALLLGLNQGHNWGWSSLPILGLLFAAAVMLALFVRIESRVPAPMLDLSLFRRRLFSLSISSAVINYICVYSVMFLLPFYLIQGRGLNPAEAGLLLSTQPIVMAIVSPVSGTLSDRIGVRLPGVLGMSCLAVGLFLLSRLGSQSPNSAIILSLAVTGLGIGIFISPNNSALMGSAPRSRQGIAAGLLATARNVGMVLGIGFAGAILNTVIAQWPGSSSEALFSAIHISFLAAAGVALLGVLASAIRGNQDQQPSIA